MSTGEPFRTSSASPDVPQLPTISKSGSEARRRLRPSRNSTWSSSSSSRMRSLFACPSIILLMRTGDRQVDHKRTSWRRRIVAKIAPKGPHESARKIEPEPRGIGALLEGLKELVDGADARSRVGDSDRHDALAFADRDIDSLQVGALQGPLAVLGEIQKNLQ